MTANLLIDHKPHDLGEPWSIAFPLDHDALIEVDGLTTKLPAGAVLVWTGRELHLYPASHRVRVAVRGAGVAPRDLQDGGRLLWESWPGPGFLQDFYSYDILDDAQCMRAYLLVWWRAYLEGCSDTVSRATEAAADPRLYEVQRAAAARFLTELAAAAVARQP